MNHNSKQNKNPITKTNDISENDGHMDLNRRFELCQAMRRRKIGRINERNWNSEFWNEYEVLEGIHKPHPDPSLAPCGCPTPFSKIDVTQDTRYYSAHKAIKRPNAATHSYVLSSEGFLLTDACFCSKNERDCKDCGLLLTMLGRPPPFDPYHHCMEKDFIQSLKESPHFYVRSFDFENPTEDSDGWPDSEPMTLHCIEYRGPMIHRRQWHVYTTPRCCAQCWFFISPSVIVPSPPNRRYSSAARIWADLPLVNDHAVDYQQLGLPPMKSQALMAAAEKLKADAPTETTIRTSFVRNELGGLVFLPGLVDCEPGDILYKHVETYNSEQDPHVEEFEARMDTSAGEPIARQDQKENVDLVETTVASQSEVAESYSGTVPWLYDAVHKYPDLTNRWTKAFSFVWDASQDAGDIIERFDLPIEAIHNFMNAPNALPWKQHAFYKTDMEIKILVNSQPAQSGMLVVGSMYNASRNTATGATILDASRVVQMPHVRISAGSSNSGKLLVPWVRHFPVGTVLSSDFDVPMYFHTLFVAVLMPLRTGANGPTGADVTIMVRFPNCEFYGQRNYVSIGPETFTARMDVADAVGVASPELAAVVKGVEKLLVSSEKKDCDRPQDIREPMNIYLQQNTSLSLATGTQKLKLLQLHAENKTSHPKIFVPQDDQFSTKFITETFGVSNIVQWNTAQSTGQNLVNVPVTPMQVYAPSYMAGSCQPTPMAMVSSFYGGWYGNMLMRVTFAISKFHSGRVYIVYKPDGPIEYDQVGSLYAALVDIQDQNTYTFVVPYQSPAPFMPIYNTPRGAEGEDHTPEPDTPIEASGHISIFVENALRAMETASSTIDVLIEFAAGPNFGLVLPVGTQFRVPTGQLTRIDEMTARMDAVPSDSSSDERKKTVTSSTAIGKMVPGWPSHLRETYEVRDLVKRYVPYFEIEGPELMRVTSYSDMLLCALANRYAIISVFHAPLASVSANAPVRQVTAKTYPWGGTSTDRRLTASTCLIARERVNLGTNQTISFRVPYTSYAGMLSNGLDPSTRTNEMAAYSSGRVTVVVEYQFTGANESGTSAQYFDFDVQAGAPEVRPSDYIPDLMTTMHDGFRFVKSDFNYQLDVFFRESWNTEAPDPNTYSLFPRYRVHRAMGDGGNFYVFQGFPRCNQTLHYYYIQDGRTPTRGGAYAGAHPVQMRQTNTGAWVRDLTQDGDVESNPGPDTTEARSGPSREGPERVEDEQTFIGHIHRLGLACLAVLRVPLGRMLHWSHVFMRKIRGLVRSGLGKVAGSAGKFAQAINTARRLQDTMDRVSASFESINTATNETLQGLAARNPEVISSFLSHTIEYTALIMNVWNSPTIAMCLLNIAALLSKMGLIRLGVSAFVDRFNLQARAIEDDDSVSNEYTSVVISALLGACGLGSVVLSKEPFMKGFLKETKSFFTNGFNVKRFLDSHFNVIRDFCHWIKGVFGCESQAPVEDLPADIAAWVESVHSMTELYNFPHLLGDPAFARKIMDLHDRALQFDKKFILTKTRPPAVFSVYRGKLQRAMDALGKQGLMQKSKPTPFCVYLYGDSGTGKSHLTDNLLVGIGKGLGLVSANPIYTRSLDTEYWNGYNQQKLIAIHDFAKVITGEQYRKHVSEFSSLIEPTVFNPPQAELEDKKRLVDAWAVVVTSNHAFPDVASIGMPKTVLFYRRRHQLVQVRVNPAVVEHYRTKGIELEGVMDGQKVYEPSKIPAEDFARLGRYFHLQFGIHKNGYDRAPPQTFVGWDEFLRLTVDKARTFRANEIEACKSRGVIYSELSGGVPTGFEFVHDIDDAVEARGPPEEEEEDWDEFSAAVNDIKPKPAQSHLIAADLDHDRNTALGGVEIEVDNTYVGATFEECTCTPNITAGKMTVRRCNVCKLRLPKPESSCFTEISPERGIDYHAEGKLPNFDHRIPTPLIDLRRLLTHRWSDDYIDWEAISTHCCHVPETLRFAHFEVVKRANGEEKLEAVLDMSHIHLDLSKLSPNMRTMIQQKKIILPAQCGLRPYRYVRSCPDMAQRGAPPVPDGLMMGGLRSKPWRITCNTVTRPRAAYFTMHDGVMKTIISGVHIKATPLHEQANLLNELVVVDSRQAFEIFNTFFYYQVNAKPRVERYVDGLTRVIGYLWSVAVPILSWVLVLSPLIAAYYLTRNSADLQMNAQVSQSGDIRKTEAPKSNVGKFVHSAPQMMTAQCSQKLGYVANAFVKVTKGTATMNGVRLCNNYVIFPYHLCVVPGDFTIAMYRNGNQSGTYNFPAKTVQLSRADGEDFCVARFPGLPAAANVLNYFVAEREFNTVRAESDLIFPMDGGLAIKSVTIKPYHSQVKYNNGNEVGDLKIFLKGWEFPIGTGSFLCGSLVMSNDQLVGLYVCENRKEGRGIAVAVSRDMIRSHLKVLGASDIDMKIKKSTLRVVPGSVKIVDDEADLFIPVGKAPKALVYPGKSNLEKSIIHGELGAPFRAPAQQEMEAKGAQVGYDVVWRGCKKQMKFPRPIDQSIVNEITEYLKEEMVPRATPIVATSNEPLGIDEAIIGIDGAPLLGSMKLNTSIGYPLMHEFKTGAKKYDIIKVSEDRTSVSMHEKALEEYNECHALRRSATAAPTVFMDFPKDELLKHGKDTRLINGAPLHHSIDMRRYVSECFAALTRLDLHIAVGCDVHSGDWAAIHAGHDNVVDEDYSGFGPGFHSQWIDVVRDIVLEWVKVYKGVDEEYRNVVACLFDELKCAHHIAGDFIYQVMSGSPSGAYGTDRINSIANICYQAYCYRMKYGTLTGFFESYFVVYGDDTRRTEDKFTSTEFQNCMKDIGITVTQNKSGQLSFLKRQFVKYEHKGIPVLLAPLPRPIVVDIVNWVRKPYFSQLHAVTESVDSYLSEMFHHGPVEYDKARREIRSILVAKGCRALPQMKTFDDLFRQKYLSSGLMPIQTQTLAPSSVENRSDMALGKEATR